MSRREEKRHCDPKQAQGGYASYDGQPWISVVSNNGASGKGCSEDDGD